LEVAENLECSMETLKLMIARHNFLMIIVISDLIFDCMFNLWIEFTHTEPLGPKTIGRICQLVIMIQVFMLVAVQRVERMLLMTQER